MNTESGAFGTAGAFGNAGAFGKLAKPVYNSSAKLYTCSITNGFRLTARREEGRFTPELDMNKEQVANFIVAATHGWFSKPLTEDFLRDKIQLTIPTSSLAESFEGSVEWQMVSLTISKDVFLLTFDLVGQKEDEKICIKFEEEEEIPLQQAEAIAIGPTRRQIQKKNVLKARAKAARSLFTAERLTQAYCEEFGEDTDWEGDESD
jgi:hypothetical protein